MDGGTTRAVPTPSAGADRWVSRVVSVVGALLPLTMVGPAWAGVEIAPRNDADRGACVDALRQRH